MKKIEFDDIKGNMMIPIIIIFVIAFICLCTPARKKFKECWEKCLKGPDAPEAVTYQSKAVQFTDCYDIANPLTYKQGKMRLLNAQISHLESEGGEEG